jgi:dTDP-4-amino-4,6-dideoxygalactose transaminase
VANGTEAIQLGLQALGVGPGDEVVTSAMSAAFSGLAVLAAGARPVFVDLDPRTLNLDPDADARAVTPRTRALLPVHLYGHPADMDPILELARAKGLHVLEDACQAHGARYRGRAVGSLGDAAAFSFYPSKNLGAYGDGGMVVTRDATIASRLRGLRDYGQTEKYRHASLGFNRRLDELQATVLRVQLPRLAGWNAARVAAADRYDRALAHLPLTSPERAGDATHVFHLYVVRVRQRDAARAHLDAAGILTGIHYPIPIHLQEAFQDLGHRAGDFPVTEAAAADVLSLPMYPEITEEQVRLVAGELNRFLAA